MAYQVQYVTSDGTPSVLYKTLWDGVDLIVGGSDKNMRCYSFNGVALVHRCTISAIAFSVYDICFDGTYYYTMQNTSIYAFSINKTLWTWNNITSSAIATTATYRVAYDGTYLHCGYVSGAAFRLRAVTFNGVTFTNIGNAYNLAASPAFGAIKCSGGYIFALLIDGTLYAFTFNGINYTLAGSVAALTSPGNYNSIEVFGSYIIVVGRRNPGDDVCVYTFDGVNFTLVSSVDLGGAVTALSVVHDGTYLHVSDSSSNVHSYELVGANLVLRSTVPVGPDIYSLANNSTYLFMGGSVAPELLVYKTTLRAQIAASPTSGIAPLTVNFIAS